MLKIEIIGNIGADAQVQNSNGSRFVTFRVAHTERWNDAEGKQQEETRWIDVILNKAESGVVPYLKAGAKVYVRGHLRTRVYSSKKYRRMEAGITCVATDIELCGGNIESVPRQLVEVGSGEIHEVTKYYWTDLKCAGMKKTDTKDLIDVKGNRYVMDYHGFVTPQPIQGDSEQGEAAGDSE